MSTQHPMRVALIGHGAIARILTSHLTAQDPHGLRVRVVGVLVRAERVAETEAAMAATSSDSCAVVSGVRELLALAPSLVVECAGQGAVAEYGEAVLSGGTDLMVISTGALADDDTRARLTAAAQAGTARMLLPAGAIAGLDGLGALRIGGLDSVRYTSTKPPSAWRGTPAEQAHDLGALTEPTTIFTGPAAEAARRYPKNANLAATVALAGLGLEQTEVTLVADPGCSTNIGRIDASGKYGTLSVECQNMPAPDNPKTSANTGLSMAHELLRGSCPIVI